MSHTIGLGYHKDGSGGSLIKVLLCSVCSLIYSSLAGSVCISVSAWGVWKFLSHHSCWILIPTKTSASESARASASPSDLEVLSSWKILMKSWWDPFFAKWYAVFWNCARTWCLWESSQNKKIMYKYSKKYIFFSDLICPCDLFFQDFLFQFQTFAMLILPHKTFQTRLRP